MISKNGFLVDDSKTHLGIIAVTSKPGTKRYKVRIDHSEERYTYDLNNRGETDVYPLQIGNGRYGLSVHEQTTGNQYRRLFDISIDVICENEFSAFLQPNQYAWYTDCSLAVQKANELVANIPDASDKADQVLAYITGSFLYDHMKAIMMPATGTYLPDIDALMLSGKGICFDLSALVCCMMRSQGIPTKMVVGETDRGYHAWNQIYVNGQWQMVDVTNEIAAMEIRRYSPQLYY